VMDAVMAIQKARILSNSVISLPTVRINLGPYEARPMEIPKAPTIMTQTGMDALDHAAAEWHH
jgi:hypothetical protein